MHLYNSRTLNTIYSTVDAKVEVLTVGELRRVAE